MVCVSAPVPQTLAARLGAVVVGVGGALPWMAVIYVLVRRGDEGLTVPPARREYTLPPTRARTPEQGAGQ